MRRSFLAALALGATLTAMTASPILAQSPSAAPDATGPLAGSSWVLTSYVSGGSLIDVAEGYVVDATFSASTVAGFSGCNQYIAPATATDTTLTIGSIATTGRMCKMTIPIEQDYLAALATAASYTASDTELSIADASGATVLTYAAASDNPLDGPWVVTGYNNGAEAVVSPVADSEITITFAADGQVFGTTGCNSFSGPYTVDGDQLTVGAIGLTMMACEDALNAQESQFLAALQTPTTIEVSGPMVTLRAADGATQVTLTRP